VFELARDASRKSRELYQSMLGPNGNPQALMSVGARLRQENERAATQILQPAQKQRVEEIVLQAEGPLAVARPEDAAKLGRSTGPSRQVQAMMFQMMQAQRAMLQGAAAADGLTNACQVGLSRSDRARLRDAAVQQLGRILTAKQKDAFNKMLGEPFDMSKID